MKDLWQARIAIVAVLVLYLRLPPKLTFGPVWVAPLIVFALLIPLFALAPIRLKESRLQRALGISLIAILNFFNIVSVYLLVRDLLVPTSPHHLLNAFDLLRSGALVWSTNIVIFALWFWELDNDGPAERAVFSTASQFDAPDFLFPQMSLDRTRIKGIDPHWKPVFLDYLYLSFTNALAVSPTDVLPLSRVAKMLMLVESLISFATIALILARSVNILA